MLSFREQFFMAVEPKEIAVPNTKPKRDEYQWYAMITAVLSVGDRTATELANILIKDVSNVSKKLKRMEALGIVKSYPITSRSVKYTLQKGE